MKPSYVLAELKRRKVFRVAAVYGVVAFVIAQAADIAFPALQLPPWTVTLVVALALLGFPVALVLAWAFEVTPDGVVRTQAAPGNATSIDESSREGTPRHGTPPTGASPAELAANGESSFGRSAALGGVSVLAIGAVILFFFGTPFFAPHEADAVDGAEVEVERSIAVLPFTNLSPDPDNEFFSDGITEEILATLAGIGELRVTSRTSAMAYKGVTRPVREIASELGVASVLEGSVRRSGDQVRITAQLIDARTDEHLWAETFERELTVENLFGVQSEIAREIAGVLEARLSPAERGRLERRPTGNLAAYELYLRSLGFQRAGGPTPPEAMTYLRAALELDPEFALASAGLADVFYFRHLITARGEYLDSARAHVERALALDPELPHALRLRAQDLADRGDAPAALAVLRRALEMSPNHAGVLLALAEVHLELGGYTEALEYARRGATIERTSGIYQALQGAVFARVGAFEEARHRFQEADRVSADMPWTGMPPPLRARFIESELAAGRRAEVEPHYEEIREVAYRLDQPRAWELLGEADLALGDFGRAREHLERQRATLPEVHEDVFTGLAFVYRNEGLDDEAAALLAETEETARRWLAEGGRSRAFAHFTLAQVHAIQGDAESAVQALESAVASGWDDYYAARLDPRLAGLEGQPGYEAVMGRVRATLDRARVRLLSQAGS